MEIRTLRPLPQKAQDTATSHQLVRFDASQCMPEKAELLDHSVSRRQRISQGLQQDIADVLSEAPDLLRPMAVWGRMNVDGEELKHFTKLPSKVLAKVEHSFGVVCTIGYELEARSRQYFDGEQYTRGYLLDRIGTLAIARVARRSAVVLRDEHHMLRWAPGDACDDWSLSGQTLLFQQLPTHMIGVNLTGHNVMVPTKSLSFVLLAGRGMKRSGCTIPCSRCVWNGACDEVEDVAKRPFEEDDLISDRVQV